MADSNLPKEDRADIRPHDIPGIRSQEGVGGRTRGGHDGSGPGGRRGRRRGDHAGSSSSGSTRRSRQRGDHAGHGGSDSGLYNPEGDKAASPSEIDNAESQGDLYNDDGADLSKKPRRRFLRRHWKGATAGGVAGLGVLGTVLLSSITQGPLELIHLDEILQKPSFGANEDSKIVWSRMFRYYKTGNIGETRVSSLGSKIVGDTLDELKKIGVEFQRDSLGQIKSGTIDTGKLKAKYPQLESMSDPQRRAFVAEKLGVPESQLSRIGTGKNVDGTKFAFNNRDAGVKSTRLMLGNTMSLLEDGKLLTSIRFRQMAKFFNTPSLFHPIERAKATVQKKSTTKSERKQALDEEAERQKRLEEPTLEKSRPAEGRLRDKLTGRNLVASALLLTSGMCLIRDIADNVVAVNFGSIVMPSTLKAVDKQAVGEQAKSGEDITARQAGAVADGFVDKNGKTIWEGKALQALAGSPLNGEELPHDYQQAFKGETSAKGIKDYLGGGGFGEAACSTPGQIVQGVIGVGIIISGFFDAGASWGAKAAQLGAEGANAVASAGVIALIESQSTRLLANKALVPETLSGPLGGNLMAYGARMAANMSARASGGVPLSRQAEAALALKQQQEDQQQFRSQSFFARTFNAKDYRSLTGRMAHSLSPSLSQNLTNTATGLLDIGSWLPRMFSSLVPKASADIVINSYNFTFRLVGIPPEVLDDPQLQDPYVNADKTAELMDSDSGEDYRDKAVTCFGKDDNGEMILESGGKWDVVAPTEPINPNSDEYIEANCGDVSDQNWRRVILFVYTTLTLKAAACANNDEQACADLAIPTADAGGGGAATPSTVAGASVDLAHLGDPSDNIACAANTKDLGIQDGYTEGKKIKIRICAVSNLPSSGEESNGNYGVSGADGKAVVNSRVSGAMYALVEAAKADGIPMSASSSFRTMSHQEALCAADGGCAGGDYTFVAQPGTSNHQLGVAIDFNMADQSKYALSSSNCVDINGVCSAPGDKVWEWLTKNASKFDYQQYVNEFWHWSPNGH